MAHSEMGTPLPACFDPPPLISLKAPIPSMGAVNGGSQGALPAQGAPSRSSHQGAPARSSRQERRQQAHPPSAQGAPSRSCSLTAPSRSCSFEELSPARGCPIREDLPSRMRSLMDGARQKGSLKNIPEEHPSMSFVNKLHQGVPEWLPQGGQPITLSEALGPQSLHPHHQRD